MSGGENYNTGELDERAEVGVIHSLATLNKKSSPNIVSNINNSATTGGDQNGVIIGFQNSTYQPGGYQNSKHSMLNPNDSMISAHRRRGSNSQLSYLVSEDYSIDVRQKLSSKVYALNENTIRVNASKSLHYNSLSNPVTFQNIDHFASQGHLEVPGQRLGNSDLRGNESVYENRDDSMIAQSPLPADQPSNFSRLSRTSRIGQASKVTTTRLEPNMLHSDVLPTEMAASPEQSNGPLYFNRSILTNQSGAKTEPPEHKSWQQPQNAENTSPANLRPYPSYIVTPPAYNTLTQQPHQSTATISTIQPTQQQPQQQPSYTQTPQQQPQNTTVPQQNAPQQQQQNGAVTQAPKPEYIRQQEAAQAANTQIKLQNAGADASHKAAKARAFNLYKYVATKSYQTLGSNPIAPDFYIPEMKMSLNRARYITTYFGEQVRARGPWKTPAPVNNSWWQFGSASKTQSVQSNQNAKVKRGIIALDLDETLIHAESLEPHVANNLQLFKNKDYDDRINVLLPNGEWQEFGVRVRPYAREFLRDLYDMGYNLVVYTASIKNYADQIVKILDPKETLISCTMHREHCLHLGGLYIKELQRIENSDPNDTIIVDNYVHSFAVNLGLGFPIKPYYQGREDYELELLAEFIRDNAPKYNNLSELMTRELAFEAFYSFLDRTTFRDGGG